MKKDPDKKLSRFSTIVEIITNLGTIASWILGVGSAYVLNIQKFPVVVPGIDFTLDLSFQFALLISAMLGYIHFLQKYWERNAEKLKLSDSFIDFSFWDLPRLRQPLLLIPIVIAFAIFVQVSIKSYWLMAIFLGILVFIGFFIFKRFSYYLSDTRDYEKMIADWKVDDKWFEKWSRRIKKQLTMYVGVRESDLYESGMTKSKSDKFEIIMAMHQYFERYEFDEDLVLTRVDELNYLHPLHHYEFQSTEWVLLPRKSLAARKSVQ